MFDLLSSKAFWIVSTLIIVFVVERIYPATTLRGGLRRIVKNISLAALNAIASPFIVIPITAFAASHTLNWRPETWSGWHTIIFDLLILDCWIYFWHRINHELPFLWRFHEVHHLDETLDASSALRFHFGEVILSSLVRAVVIILLAVPPTTVAIFELCVAIAALFHHSNLRLPKWLESALSKVIVTPSIHWVHHHAIRRDTDSNYGTFFSFWDRIFGTTSNTIRTEQMPIGVEGRKDEALPQLVIRPFHVNQR